ncbi:hypothetical protein EVAR_103320_1, partial [Eumeta japonica]
ENQKTRTHVFVYPRFSLQRDELETILNQRIQPETLVETMLSTKLPGTLLARLLQKSLRTCAFRRKKKAKRQQLEGRNNNTLATRRKSGS